MKRQLPRLSFLTVTMFTGLLTLASGDVDVRAGDAAAVGKTQQLTSPDQVPEGLQKSDWASIRAAHTAWEHGFMPIDGGWQARSPGQQWPAEFVGRGFLMNPHQIQCDRRWTGSATDLPLLDNSLGKTISLFLR